LSQLLAGPVLTSAGILKNDNYGLWDILTAPDRIIFMPLLQMSGVKFHLFFKLFLSLWLGSFFIIKIVIQLNQFLITDFFLEKWYSQSRKNDPNIYLNLEKSPNI